MISATLPEGPINIARYNSVKGEKRSEAKEATISVQMLWRVANAIEVGVPINFDRVLGASYNTRSALEALLAHTSEFYWCLPGRIEILNSSSEIKRGHKHLLWKPDEPHENGILFKHDTELVVSELPSSSVVYESMTGSSQDGKPLDIEVDRRHLQVQIALLKIGYQLGSRI